jgi:peptidoglycan/LPS O-acetylase OafA/YrhL
MLGLLNSRPLQLFFSNRFGRSLGRISFTLYLIHLPMICSLTAWQALLLQGHSYSLLVIVAGISSLFAILGIATLLTRFADTIPTTISQRVGRWIDMPYWRKQMKQGPCSTLASSREVADRDDQAPVRWLRYGLWFRP